MDDRRLSRLISAICSTRWCSVVLAATLLSACARRPVAPPPPPPPPVYDAGLHARVLEQVELAPGVPFDHSRFELILEDVPLSEETR